MIFRCGRSYRATTAWLRLNGSPIFRTVGKPFRGYWQISDDGYWHYQDGNPIRHAFVAMAIKSTIGRPRTREFLQAGEFYESFGASWGGKGVGAMDLSTDDGKTWQPVQFPDEAQTLCLASLEARMEGAC